MDIYLNEIKRILSKRANQIIIISALAFSVMMAIIPISFVKVTIFEKGQIKGLRGKPAIEYIKGVNEDYTGKITRDMIEEGAKKYRSVLKEYNVSDSYELEAEVNKRELVPMEHLNKIIRETYTDFQRGASNPLLNIDQYDFKNLYEKIPDYLETTIENEYPEKARGKILTQAEEKLKKVKTPYEYYGYYNSDVNDYRNFYNTILTLMMVAIAAPLFSEDREDGLDKIFKTSKNGRTKFASSKILASLSVCGLVMIVGKSIQGAIIDEAFGTEYKKTSIQMIFSVLSGYNLNFGQYNTITNICGLITLFSSILQALTISLFSEKRSKAIIVSLLAAIFPAVISPIAMVSAINYIFPSSGIGLYNSLSIQIADFNYVNLFGKWMRPPELTMISASLYIIVFTLIILFKFSRGGEMPLRKSNKS